MARLYDKLLVIGIIGILLTGTVAPAFATHEHTPDDNTVGSAKLTTDGEVISGQADDATPASTDTVLVFDVSALALTEVTLANLVANGGGAYVWRRLPGSEARTHGRAVCQTAVHAHRDSGWPGVAQLSG